MMALRLRLAALPLHIVSWPHCHEHDSTNVSAVCSSADAASLDDALDASLVKQAHARKLYWSASNAIRHWFKYCLAYVCS